MRSLSFGTTVSYNIPLSSLQLIFNNIKKKTDLENCPAPTNASGYSIVNNIRSIAQTFGSVKLFKAYLEVTEQVPLSRASLLRSELQSSGVTLADCPHNGRKDVADKMILGICALSLRNPCVLIINFQIFQWT